MPFTKVIPRITHLAVRLGFILLFSFSMPCRAREKEPCRGKHTLVSPKLPAKGRLVPPGKENLPFLDSYKETRFGRLFHVLSFELQGKTNAHVKETRNVLVSSCATIPMQQQQEQQERLATPAFIKNNNNI